MAKGVLKQPQDLVLKCQFCEKNFKYHRTTSVIRKSCYDCIPDGKGNDASLIRRLIKEKAVRIKGGKCEICGLEDESCVYDFHHKDPKEKDFHLGDKTSTVKWELVEKELDKCLLVCSNCHRKIHFRNIDK